MKTIKLGAIFLMSVLAIAGVGTGYALWWDELHLDVTVDTGYINAELSWEGYTDTEPPEKNFSWITYNLQNDFRPDQGAMDQTNGWLWIYMHNVYPCITYTITFNIENTGTIPIHVEPLDFNRNDIVTSGYGTIDVYHNDGGAPFSSWIQLHPGDIWYGKIVIHFDNDLPQNHGPDHMICADFAYHQWNEEMPN